jgi:peptide chain release factor 1
MNPSIASKLTGLDARLKEIDSRLADPEVGNDRDTLRKLSQERAEIQPVVELFNEYRKAEGDVAAAEDMARDPGMRDFAQEELKSGRARQASLEADLQRMLLPRDPNDDKNLFLEIRAGTGGDESALFAGDLLRMYTRFAERNRWQVGSFRKPGGRWRIQGGYRAHAGARLPAPVESGGNSAARPPPRPRGASHLRRDGP